MLVFLLAALFVVTVGLPIASRIYFGKAPAANQQVEKVQEGTCKVDNGTKTETSGLISFRPVVSVK